MRRAPLAVVAAMFALAPIALATEKPKKPRLDLRATPRISISPVNVLLVAELPGGDDVEDFHCPELEWDWDDGGKSSHQSDCEPLSAGAPLERRFAAQHSYRRSGTYNIRLTMRRAERLLAVGSTTVDVRPGLGESGGLD